MKPIKTFSVLANNICLTVSLSAKMSRVARLVFSISILVGWASTALPQDWIRTSAPDQRWKSIACSADGTKVIAGSQPGVDWGVICTSTNGGVTWISNTAPLGYWTAVASSADGGRFYALGSPAGGGLGVYTSTDYGLNWTLIGTHSNAWFDVSCSADGTRLIAGGRQSAVQTSKDSGLTWRESIPFPGFWGVASSADGTRLYAVTGQSMFASIDGGITWQTNIVSGSVYSVACSADGKTVIAASGDYVPSPTFVSTNGGADWTQTNMVLVKRVAASADGFTLAAAGWSGLIQTSTDSGATWSEAAPQSPFGGYWNGLASSADGAKLFAVDFPGGIWVSENAPRPILSITPSEGSLLVSWLVPSRPFVLQECRDLGGGNWIDVTVNPTLNYTNIHYEVTLPVAAGNQFYRLKSG